MFICKRGMSQADREAYLSRPKTSRGARAGGRFDLRSLSANSWTQGFYTFQGQEATARLTPQAEAQRDQLVRAGRSAKVRRWSGNYSGTVARLTVTEVVGG